MSCNYHFKNYDHTESSWWQRMMDTCQHSKSNPGRGPSRWREPTSTVTDKCGHLRAQFGSKVHRFMKRTAALAQVPNIALVSPHHSSVAAAVVYGLEAFFPFFFFCIDVPFWLQINNNPAGHELKWVNTHALTCSSVDWAPSHSIISCQTPTPGQKESTCSCSALVGCYLVTAPSICLPSHVPSQRPQQPSYRHPHSQRWQRPGFWPRLPCWSRLWIKGYISVELIMRTCTCQAQYWPGDKKTAGCMSTCLIRLCQQEILLQPQRCNCCARRSGFQTTDCWRRCRKPLSPMRCVRGNRQHPPSCCIPITEALSPRLEVALGCQSSSFSSTKLNSYKVWRPWMACRFFGRCFWPGAQMLQMFQSVAITIEVQTQLNR